MGNVRFLPVAVGTAALILTGCSSTSPEDPGGEVDSGIMHVPVPETAVDSEAYEYDENKSAWYIEDVLFDDVVSWYEDRLPIGERYEDLAFCREIVHSGNGDPTVAWLWWGDETSEETGAGLWIDIVGKYSPFTVDESPTSTIVTVKYDPHMNPDC